MKHIEFRAMNCEMSAVLDTDSIEADALLTDVPKWFEAWEQTFSRFRPESELSRLNASAGQVFKASEDLWTVVDLAVRTARTHQGLVTPTVLNALVDAGYGQSFEQLMDVAPSKRAINQPQTLDALAQIKCDEQARTVYLPPEVHLDLGGFVKGWCADAVVQRLSQHAPALMDAGGDIAVSGAMADGGDWAIGITDPFDAEHDLALVMVKGCGVATSGRDYRKWTQDGLARHHIIDPRTGKSALTDVLSATVIAPSTQLAELASKMLLILGLQAGMEWLKAQEGYAACMVLEDGALRMNALFEQYRWQAPASAVNKI